MSASSTDDDLPDVPVNREDRIAVRSEERSRRRRSARHEARLAKEASVAIDIVYAEIREARSEVALLPDEDVLERIHDTAKHMRVAARTGFHSEALRAMAEVMILAGA